MSFINHNEENPFEKEVVAEEWIKAIENEKNGSRDREIYPMLYKWSQDISSGTILEIGSGQGVCSSKIDILDKKYIGIEPSTLLVNRAKELYKENNKEFIIGNAYDIPVFDESIEGVFSIGVWFHLGNLDLVHKEIKRILKPNGKILIITSNPNLYRLWEGWFENPKKEGKILDGKVNVPTGTLSRSIFYLHSEEEIIDSLKAYSLSVLSIEKFGFGKEGKELHRDEGIWMAIKAEKK